jgi:transcriptional regulator with XRE-family HTH domain
MYRRVWSLTVTTTTEQPEPPSVPVYGAEMRRRRKLLGYTLAGFAEQADISESYVSLIEGGGRPNVSPPVFVRICDALHIAAKNRKELVAPNPQIARKAG